MTRPCIDHRRSLAVGDVHLWTVRFNFGHSITTDLWQILDKEERARAAQFSFERDRVRFIQTHGIVRQILARYCDTDAAMLTFACNRQGKPYLIPQADGPNLQFSVSHSGDCCMLALRLDYTIGIDVEEVRDLPQAINIAKSYFTPAESRALAALQGAAQREAFFVWWTHKEAAIKATGQSLAADLGRVEFDFDLRRGLRLVAWNGDQSVAQKWFVLRIDPGPGYIAALAGMHPIRALTLRNWNPTA